MLKLLVFTNIYFVKLIESYDITKPVIAMGLPSCVTDLFICCFFWLQIIIAGLSLPWLGYLAGYSISRILNQPTKDRLAISIEAGIQNTGIAIFILRFALGQPEADLTTIIPVSVAIMTPLPLLGFYICLRCRQK